MSDSTRRCKRCGGNWDIDFFRVSQAKQEKKSGDADPSKRLQRLNGVCIGCENTDNDRRKEEKRSWTKAVSCCRNHRVSYNKKNGTNLTTPEFKAKFDWDPSRMAEEIDRLWEGACPSCDELFQAKPKLGFGNITLDQIRPDDPPHYRTNVRWICQTCNTRKARVEPSRFSAQQVIWPKYMEHRRYLEEHDGYGPDTLLASLYD